MSVIGPFAELTMTHRSHSNNSSSIDATFVSSVMSPIPAAIGNAHRRQNRFWIAAR